MPKKRVSDEGGANGTYPFLMVGTSSFGGIDLCKSIGKRLPTAREFAMVARGQGAKGISEVPKEGYQQNIAQDSNGKVDTFYYSKEGHKRPEGDLGDKYFWSDSVDPEFNESAFCYHAGSGDIDVECYAFDEFINAVICLK